MWSLTKQKNEALKVYLFIATKLSVPLTYFKQIKC